MKMKTLFLLPILLLSLISTSCWSVDLDAIENLGLLLDKIQEITVDPLVIRDGLYYEKFSDTPFTGRVEGSANGRFVNGKFNGEWVFYYDNGQLYEKGSFKNGKKEGKWVVYFQNGQLFHKGSYKNGERDGEWVIYHSDGQLDKKLEYKDGIKICCWN